MEKISYKLTVFEGPMDLLLHLISKHKIDINDIPIIELVEQYTAYVRQMQEENMEVASEFLEMAARLVYIKTVSLLPVHEEAQQLQKELTGELLEYQECQMIAKKLEKQADGFNFFTREPQTFEQDMTYTRLHEAQELVQYYLCVTGKRLLRLPPPAESFSGIVDRKIVSVSSKIFFVLRNLIKSKRQRLNSLLKHSKSRSDLVATFLAILELAKAKRITVTGDVEDLQIELKEGAENS